MAQVRMPDLGETSNIVVVSWLCDEGDSVSEGEDLVEVETEKTTFVIASPATGKLSKISVQQGDSAAVDDILAQID